MARAAGSSAPQALSLRQAMPWALAAVLGALSTVLFHPMIGLPIAGTALAVLVYGRRVSLAVCALFVGGALTGLLARATLYVVVFPLVEVPVGAEAPYVYTALVLMSLTVVGPLTAALMRRRPALETAVSVTVALTVLQVTALAAFAAGTTLSTRGYIDAAAMGVATSTGMGEELGTALAAMWPGALVTMNGFTAMLAIAGIGVVGTRLGAVLRRIPAFTTLDLDARTVVLPIAAIALLAAGRLSFAGAETVEMVGKNLLVIARWVFFLQGVAVFAGLYERAKLARPIRLGGFVLLGVTEALAPAVSLTGLADIWLNLRRLPRDGSQAQTVEPPAGTE